MPIGFDILLSHMNILILEDHLDLNDVYKVILGRTNKLTIATSLKELDEIQKHNDLSSFDVAICDLKLPDGFFIDWVIENGSNLIEQVPTIIVSSLVSEDTLSLCFDRGAYDYLIKPFKASELEPKVGKARRIFQEKVQLDSDEEMLEDLTSIEAKIFQQFLKKKGEILARGVLIDLVWKKNKPSLNNFGVHMSNLRKKLLHTNWSIDYVKERGWTLVKKPLNERLG